MRNFVNTKNICLSNFKNLNHMLIGTYCSNTTIKWKENILKCWHYFQGMRRHKELFSRNPFKKFFLETKIYLYKITIYITVFLLRYYIFIYKYIYIYKEYVNKIYYDIS